MSTPQNEEGLTQGTSGWLEDHMRIVRKRILDGARELAQSQGRDIEPRDIAEAAKGFAPGIKLPESETSKQKWWQVILYWTPSPILVSSLLAIAFGLLGVYRGGQGAFDIAKVFAGAIVGSAAATAKSTVKQT